ncbi:F0F1 ATP synthase subunit gamma [Micrococcales bacterium 31B]|nr:F0F1 ATP synthase subunit gamma [Micrococcales bacterium 31B]
MGAQQRVYRNRIKSTKGLKKIFNAMELVSASRIAKAQARVAASTPYANAITRAVSAVATNAGDVQHPMLEERTDTNKVAVLLVTADRGQAGAYSSNVIKRAAELAELLEDEGKQPVFYVAGRKGVSYFRFRNRALAHEWTDISDKPQSADANAIAKVLLAAFAAAPGDGGVSELHIVFTRFRSMVSQEPTVIRLLPLEVVDGVTKSESDIVPLYDFEPDAAGVLDALLPRYIESRIFNCLLQAAASEHAARQRAMKAASDNAQEQIRNFTRLANSARQAEITQEISEIVGGVDALASASKKKR